MIQVHPDDFVCQMQFRAETNSNTSASQPRPFLLSKVFFGSVEVVNVRVVEELLPIADGESPQDSFTRIKHKRMDAWVDKRGGPVL